jgi:endonuclease I
MTQATIDKDRYKEELRLQIMDKKKRLHEEKQKKIRADLLEEERIKREIEEMNMHYQQYGSEREGQTKDPIAENVFKKQNVIPPIDIHGKE